MTKQSLVSILLILTELLVQAVTTSHHASRRHFGNSKLHTKKSIIPRHESDTKYGGLFRVIEPSEEIDKRSRFGQIGNTANQLHELERFIAGYSRGSSQKSRKKSDISRGKNSDKNIAVSRQRESNENIALIRSIIEKMSRNKDIQNSIDDGQHFTKKQNIEPALNTQKENQSTANEVRKIENPTTSLRDETSYGSSPTNPGMSCSDIFQKYPNFPSGVYWIKSADGKETMRIHCEKATDGFTYVKPVLHSGKEWKPVEKSNSTKSNHAGKTKFRKVVHAVVGDHMQMGDNPQLKEEDEPEDPDQIKSGMWPYDPLSTLLPAATNGSNAKEAQSTNKPALKSNNNNYNLAEAQSKTYSDETFSGAATSENKTANNTAITDSNDKAPSNETGASNSTNATVQGVGSKGEERINQTDSWAIGARASDSKPSEKTDTSLSSEIKSTKTPTVAKGVTAMKPTGKQAKKPDTLEEYENERKKEDSTTNSSTIKTENSNLIAPGRNEKPNGFVSLAPGTSSSVDYANYGLLGDIPGATTRQIEPTAALSEKDNTQTLKKNSTNLETIERKEKSDKLNKADTAKENVKESSTLKPDDKDRSKNTTSNESRGPSSERKKAADNSTNEPEKELTSNSSSSTNKETKSINGTSEDKQKANATENNNFSYNTKTENKTDESKTKTKPSKPASDNVLNSKASYQYIENTTTPLDNTEYHEALGKNSANTSISKDKERNPDNSSLAQNFFPHSKAAEPENKKPGQLQLPAEASLQKQVSSSNQVATEMTNLSNIHQIVPSNPINSIQPLAALPLSQVSSGNPQFFVNSPALKENATTLTSGLPVNPVTGDRTLNSSVAVVALRGDEGTISDAPLNGIPTADFLKSKEMQKHTPLKFLKNINNKKIEDYDIYDVGRKKSVLVPMSENSKRSHNTFKDLDKALAGTNFSIQNGVSTQLTFKSNIDDENQGKIVNEEKRSVIENEIALPKKKKYKRSWEKELAKISDSLQGSNLSIQNNVDSRLTFKSHLPQVRLTAVHEQTAKVKKSNILGKSKQSAISGHTFYRGVNSSKDSNSNDQKSDQKPGSAKDPAKDQSSILVKNVSNHSVNEENVLKAVFNVQMRNESETVSNNSNSISLNDIKHHEIDQNNVLHAVFNVRENSQNNTQGNTLSTGSSKSSLGGSFKLQDHSQTTARAKIEQQKILWPKLKQKSKQQLKKSKTDNVVRKRKKSEDQTLEIKNASKVTGTAFNVAVIAKTDVSLGVGKTSGKYQIRKSKSKNQAESIAGGNSKSKRLRKRQKKKSSKKSKNSRRKDPVKKFKNSKFQGSNEKRLAGKVPSRDKTSLRKENLKNTNNKRKKKESKKMKGKNVAKYSMNNENGKGISKQISQPQLFMKRQEVTVQTSSFKINAGNRQLIPTEIGKIEPSESEGKDQSDRAETITKNSNQPNNDTSVDSSHKVNTGSALYNEPRNSTSNNSTSATSNQFSGDNASLNNSKANDVAQPAKPEEQSKVLQNQAGPENANTNSTVGLGQSQEKMPDLNQILNFTVGFLNKTFHEHFKGKQASGDKTEKSNNVANNSLTQEGHQVAGSNNNGNQQNNTAESQPLPMPLSQIVNSTTNNSTSDKGNTTTSPVPNNLSNATGSGGIANGSAQLSKSQKVPGTASATAVSDMMSPVENYILNMINTSGAEHFGNGSSGSGKRDSKQVSETANEDQKQNGGNVLNVLNPSNLGDISKLGNLHITSNEYSISFTPKSTGKGTTTNESVKEGPNSKLINPASKKGKIENSTQSRKPTSKRLKSSALAKKTGGMKSKNARNKKDASQAGDTIQVNAQFTTAHKLQRISSSSKGSSSASSIIPRENSNNYKHRERNDKIRNILHKKNLKSKIDKTVAKKTNDQQNPSKQGSNSATNGFPIKIEGNKIDWGPVSENWPNFGLG